jgi:hypothetical protein
MMQNSELVVLSTADLWALHETVAELLVDRIAKRFRELDAQLARLPPKARALNARRGGLSDQQSLEALTGLSAAHQP